MYYIKFKVDEEKTKFYKKTGIIPMKRYPVVSDHLANGQYTIIVFVGTDKDLDMPKVINTAEEQFKGLILFDGFVEPKPAKAISNAKEKADKE